MGGSCSTNWRESNAYRLLHFSLAVPTLVAGNSMAQPKLQHKYGPVMKHNYLAQRSLRNKHGLAFLNKEFLCTAHTES
jgi:hypothetical protein